MLLDLFAQGQPGADHCAGKAGIGMKTVQDKVAVITGSTRGIGNAIARLFAEEGASVVITGRNEEECIRAAEKINKSGGKAYPVRVDVSDFDDFNAMTDKVIEQFGRIDVLVNNVAVRLNRPFLETDRELMEKGFSVIFGAAFLGSQRVAQEMIKRNIKGRIIHIGSTAGLYGERNHSLYCSLKSSLMNLAKTMALELGEYGITVNVVNPGTTVLPDDQRGGQYRRRPLLRPGSGHGKPRLRHRHRLLGGPLRSLLRAIHSFSRSSAGPGKGMAGL